MDVTPKKSLGQHWLHDTASLEAMCNAAQVQKGDHVLEIGPGLGTLTVKLLNQGAVVTAVEFDTVLAQGLAKRIAETISDHEICNNLTVIEADILTFDLRGLPSGYKVVANIPYYLTSHLIRILGESSSAPSVAAVLVQKEVAQRVCAGSGSMSILAATTQFYFDCSLGMIVPAALFVPPPKVDSQILVLIRRPQPLFDVVPKNFFRVIKAGFSEKRKTLRNSLSGGLGLEKAAVESLLETCGLPENARAQELSLSDWKKLYDAIKTA